MLSGLLGTKSLVFAYAIRSHPPTALPQGTHRMALLLGLSGPAGERVSMRNAARGCITTLTFHLDCRTRGRIRWLHYDI